MCHWMESHMFTGAQARAHAGNKECQLSWPKNAEQIQTALLSSTHFTWWSKPFATYNEDELWMNDSFQAALKIDLATRWSSYYLNSLSVGLILRCMNGSKTFELKAKMFVPFSSYLSIKSSNHFSSALSTWTYRSFVLYRRTTDGFAVWSDAPAVSGIGMALHLFGKEETY